MWKRGARGQEVYFPAGRMFNTVGNNKRPFFIGTLEIHQEQLRLALREWKAVMWFSLYRTLLTIDVPHRSQHWPELFLLWLRRWQEPESHYSLHLQSFLQWQRVIVRLQTYLPLNLTSVMPLQSVHMGRRLDLWFSEFLPGNVLFFVLPHSANTDSTEGWLEAAAV